jgi:polyisoprenoid-binding protein YceI
MTPQNTAAVRYAVDPRASQFTVQAFASGLISVVAHSPKIAIRDWTGNASFVPDTLNDAKLKVVIKTASLDVLDELRESDKRELLRVMNDDVLETRRFPEVVFESSHITADQLKDALYRVNVEGSLSLHGVTNSHTFFAQVAFGVDSFRAHGEFTLLQTDYEIRVASIASGTLKLQDDLPFTSWGANRFEQPVWDGPSQMMEEDRIVHATRPLSEDVTVRYVIDTTGSTFFVKVFSSGLLSAFAHDPKIAIRKFDGDVSFSGSGGTLTDGRLTIRIPHDSLEVVDDVSEKDRQEIHNRISHEVLETDGFPEIVYECMRVTASGGGDRYWAALNGDLTLHGVTRSLPLSARVIINGDSLRASGEFSLKQSDFEIVPVTAAAGTVRVKDELKFTFDIVARKQE